MLRSLTVFILFFSFSVSAFSQNYLADVKKQKVSDAATLKKVKAQVAEIRKSIIKNNKKFRVDITEAIKHRIEEITGAKVPENFQKESEEQFIEGNKKFEDLKREEKIAPSDRSAEVKPEKVPDVVPEKKPEKISQLVPEKQPAAPEKAAPVIPAKPEVIPQVIPKKEQAPAKVPEKMAPIAIVPAAAYLAGSDPSMKAFNWRDAGMMTDVKNQQTCGCCWSFTSMAVYEGCYKIEKGESLDLSEQYILDYAKDKRGRDAGSCEGGWFGGVFDYMSANGAVTERELPYKNSRSSAAVKFDSNLKVATWSYVDPNGKIPSVAEVKKALCKHGPLAAAVKVTPAFQAYVGGIFDEYAPVSSPTDVNHAIVIVGWDDAKKAYLIKNSWGEEWGEKGYMWIEYGCNNIGFGAAWLAVK